jgi:hypothetical protein
MTVKLSIEELKRIKELFQEKKEKRKRKKAKKKGKIFPNEKQKFNGDLVSDNVVRYNFPNTGASVLSRDFQNNLGDLNNRFNNLIKDNPEKSKEYKSKYHELADNLIDDVIDGKRNIRRNKVGSTTISDLIDEPKKSRKPKISKRKVEILRTPRANDGAGDFSRTSFAPRKQEENRPTMGGLISYFRTLPNEQPKVPQFMPRGDNIDFSVSSFDGTDAVDGMPDEGDAGENPDFEQPEPDEFLTGDEGDDVEDAEDENGNASVNAASGDFSPQEQMDNWDDGEDVENVEDENDKQPTSAIKAKPKPQTNEQNDEFEAFNKKRNKKKSKVVVTDDDDEDEEDLNGMPNLKRSSSAPEANKKYKENKSFVCPDCGIAYTTEKAVRKHQKEKH